LKDQVTTRGALRIASWTMPSSFHRIRTSEAHRRPRNPARDCPIESQPIRSAIPVALVRESGQAGLKADPSNGSLALSLAMRWSTTVAGGTQIGEGCSSDYGVSDEPTSNVAFALNRL
jgi:hypothetical protein